MKLDLTPPKGWNILPLSRIITGLRGGVSVNGTDLPARNGEPGVLKLSAISYGQFAPEQNKAVIENERVRLGPSVRGNTILISRSNTTELVGACVYVPEDFPHLYLPDLIWEIEVDPSNGNSAKWLSYLLSSGAVRASLVARATGTSGSMKKLSMAALRVMQIWQPPFPEQERIAEIITTWDRAMAQAEKLIEAKRKLKTGLMQQLLTGKRRFKEFVKSEETRRTKYGELPVDWDLVCIRDIADVNKRSLPNSTAPDYEFFYVDLSAVKEGSVDFPSTRTRFGEAPSRARRIVVSGDVIMATVRPNLKGFALADFDTADTICSTGFALISPHCKSDSRFIYETSTLLWSHNKSMVSSSAQTTRLSTVVL
jgi:restriction endonuclease S subunit